jgi:CBS domain-containing protein
MKVRDVMIQDPICCSPFDSTQTAAKLMAANDVGSIPVVNQEGRLVGILTDRDIACRVVARGHEGAALNVDRVMTGDPVCCRPDDDLAACEELMKKHQIRRIPVVDDRNVCVGIVAQADIVRVEQPDKVKETITEISDPNPEPFRRVA